MRTNVNNCTVLCCYLCTMWIMICTLARSITLRNKFYSILFYSLCVNSQIPRQVQRSIRYYLKAGACWSRSRWQSKMHGQLKERLFCQFWQTIKRSCKRDKAWIGKFMLLLALFVTSWSTFIRLSFRPPAPKSRPPFLFGKMPNQGGGDVYYKPCTSLLIFSTYWNLHLTLDI